MHENIKKIKYVVYFAADVNRNGGNGGHMNERYCAGFANWFERWKRKQLNGNEKKTHNAQE